MSEIDDFENYPLSDAIDNVILMHRDAHFGGNFDIMLEYYGGLGKGVNKEFEIARIHKLYELEKTSGNNLAAVMLTGAEAEIVGEAKEAYKKLRSVYEVEKPTSIIPKLIADLIFAETEEDEEKAVAAAKQQGTKIVPYLIDLLKDDRFYNPLYPGYGLAPLLAAKALGEIGDKKAIMFLFEAIGSGDFFDEDIILDALFAIGEPAKEFLLKVLHAEPVTLDNEQAAIALIRFKNQPGVAIACLEKLKTLDLNKHLPLATYLVLACEGLSQKEEQIALLEIASNPKTPKSIRQDIAVVEHSWE